MCYTVLIFRTYRYTLSVKEVKVKQYSSPEQVDLATLATGQCYT